MTDKMMMTLMYAVFCTGVVLAFADGGSIRSLGRSGARAGMRHADLRAVIEKKYREALGKIREAEFFRALQKENTDREIYESLSYMRNLIIAHKDGINSDAVISGLAERDGALKAAYIKMLSLMRMGRVKEAEDVMCEATGTEAGREFASVLTSWEYMQPEQLSQIIVSQRKSIRENCITKQKKRDEMISNFIYFPATANIFLIFINFIYISYFMQQKEMLEMMF